MLCYWTFALSSHDLMNIKLSVSVLCMEELHIENEGNCVLLVLELQENLLFYYLNFLLCCTMLFLCQADKLSLCKLVFGFELELIFSASSWDIADKKSVFSMSYSGKSLNHFIMTKSSRYTAKRTFCNLNCAATSTQSWQKGPGC